MNQHWHDTLATPCLVIEAAIVRQNLQRMAAYTAAHGLSLRPHTKTHKSLLLGAMQMEAGATGLTVAKPGEALVMAAVTNDLLMAYPAVDRSRCLELAQVARQQVVRVAVDSATAVHALAEAATSVDAAIGLLVDLDVGHHRTGVQTPEAALELAQLIEQTRGVRFDGLLFFPGHISAAPGGQAAALGAVNEWLTDVLGRLTHHGLEAAIVSGGSTPTAYQSHLVTRQTEIRPGTYIFNDMNCVRGGIAGFDDCAARILTTVVSTAVPGQVVLDAGSKTLTSDRCGPAPDSGHGYIVEYPQARIVKLSEEHAQVDVTACDRTPKVGDRVWVIPNHICPCVNLQDRVWWSETNAPPVAMTVDARGRVS